jgi:hypothetical protein
MLSGDMESNDPRRLLEEQISRSRACIAASRQSILRSRERIDDARQVISSMADRFALPQMLTTDEQMLAATEYGEMTVEQGHIDREVRWTLAHAAKFPF